MNENPNVNEWVHQAHDRLDSARARAEQWDGRIRSFAREQPLTALLLAASGGYILARLTSMRFR